MVRSPMGVDAIPTVALKFVTAFGADFVCHAHSLNPPSYLWKFKLHHYQWAGSLGKVIFPLLYSISTRSMNVILVTDKIVFI